MTKEASPGAPLPAPHSEAITNVAMQSAMLDATIEFVITTAMYQSMNAAEFLVKNVGSDRLVKLAKALLLDHFPDEAGDIEHAFQKIADARKRRNEIIHSFWHPSANPEHASTSTHRPFRPHQTRSRDAKSVQAVADALKEATQWLRNWEERLYEARHEAWWKTRARIGPKSYIVNRDGER